ncbi:hypothetical protein [Reichenbachiella sp. MALMAid0571]|uniref:hypothetical protein n=1 Tax=Reichenbachiella sp. MALMAid0571 TaxID=3143939 RepID=UPI0032DF89AE
MKINFFKADEIDRNIKCSIHKSGKLGFSSTAIDKLGLSTGKSVMIGVNEEDSEDDNLYMSVEDGVKEEAFKISRAGEYYYANTKALFDKMGIDYRAKTIIYDIVDFEYEGVKMYKLIKREKKRNKN